MENTILGEGSALKLGDDISTDLIIPGRFTSLRSDLKKLAQHVLEDAEVEGTNQKFAALVRQGDYVVAGRNFGLGSSREIAPTTIKAAGAQAILARSFARIFFRNAINVGLPVLVCDTGQIETGDRIRVDLIQGFVENVTRKARIPFESLPPVMVRILEDGGLIAHVAKNGGFAF